jgi:hypothetical protein
VVGEVIAEGGYCKKLPIRSGNVQCFKCHDSDNPFNAENSNPASSAGASSLTPATATQVKAATKASNHKPTAARKATVQQNPPKPSSNAQHSARVSANLNELPRVDTTGKKLPRADNSEELPTDDTSLSPLDLLVKLNPKSQGASIWYSADSGSSSRGSEPILTSVSGR